MTNNLHSYLDGDKPQVYQIRIAGQLGREWTDWFGGMTITCRDNGDTLLTGPLPDQAALFGVLKQVRDLGMPLLSVHRVNHHLPGAPQDKPKNLVSAQKGGKNEYR